MYYNNGGSFDNIISRDNKKRQARKEIKSHSIVVGICLICFIALPYVLSLITYMLGWNEIYTYDYTFRCFMDMAFSIISIFIPFFVAYLYLSRKKDNPIDLPLNKPCSGKLSVYAVLAGLMLCNFASRFSVIFSSVAEHSGIYFSSPSANDPPSSFSSFLLLSLQTALIPALVEEFAMRGVVMQPLRRYGDRFALLMSSLIFSVMHGNMLQIPFGFLAGYVIGYFVIRTDSMWTGIAIHFLNNLFAVTYEYIFTVSPSVGTRIYSTASTVITVLGLISLFLFFRSKKARPILREQVYTGLKASKKAKTFLLSIPMATALIIMLVSVGRYVDF